MPSLPISYAGIVWKKNLTSAGALSLIDIFIPSTVCWPIFTPSVPSSILEIVSFSFLSTALIPNYFSLTVSIGRIIESNFSTTSLITSEGYL